ncbi:MAG TPA: dTDP-glucose 4,6-dehydratase, partial [Ignavibacteria bacterium]|nr:dTDP-glucose 4,6-dehydratase [Ignavibacteria bacterium]HMR41317.1 dTDP-glucose 4,6-dehydratase [Ignavibacteria bacterium]
MKNILVTGGAGFIGSNFIKYLLNNYNYNVVNFDKLTYAGNLENLTDVEFNDRYKFIKGDICEKKEVEKAVKENDIDTIVNFAAESHVDRSILGAKEFINTNVGGTHVLLEVLKDNKLEKYLQVSTDEVYGSLPEDKKEILFTEKTPITTNSPYSASKASADLLCNAFHHTFDLPILITRCSNNYGPYQFPEKLIPLMIAKAMDGEQLPVYGDGKNIRDWLYVDDHCSAIMAVLEKGKTGDVYNIGGNNEWYNIDIVKLILKSLKISEENIKYVKDRPGHDRRYAIDSSKIMNELGWKPEYTFETGIEKTINWYKENTDWWKKVMSGEYLKYYEENYSDKE